MVCNICGAENQDGVKFCADCGGLLGAEAVEMEAPKAEAKRPARAVKSKPINGTVKILVIAFVALAMLFGMCQLFVDYVQPGKTVRIEKTEDGKSISKSDVYAFKSMIHTKLPENLQEERDALEEQMEAREENQEAYKEELAYMEQWEYSEDEIREFRKKNESEIKIKGGYGWIKTANLLGGIGCILVAAIGVLFLLKNMVPVYDMAFKGRSALGIMGLGGAVVAVLQLLLTSFAKVTYIKRFEEDVEKVTHKFGAHWTVWAFLIISVLFIVYNMATAKNKKK